ncbi:cation transporter [Actinomadura madurae]|uniref:cation transporter n=1 Tax=Actinomadura madurae TaxID=1993 RepID=UPI0020D22EF7|nr:heavy metal-associated domain-containing protein [Actinomadura madurae]MCP9981302.1 heavy-metal-associated domain-containing protein [Actinomadura madurae]
MSTEAKSAPIELTIGGMTCASCANRIERKLNKMDGVTATVNYATEKARVEFPAEVSPEDLIATVEKAGYTAALPPRRRRRARRTPRPSRTTPCARSGSGSSPRSSCRFPSSRWR